MNTLVNDLKILIDKHLSTIEDLFINNQTYEQIKTIKKAIKRLNWKWILYFLQRYQRSILEEAYNAAQCVENKELMDIFESMFGQKKCINWNRYKKFEYLAKTGQYDKLDQMKIISEQGSKLRILSGLVICGDLETIKSNRYGNLILTIKNFATQHLVLYKIYKHNRLNILEYIKSNNVHIDYNTDLLVRILTKQTITEEDIANIDKGSCYNIVVALTKLNCCHYVKHLIDENVDLTSACIEGLVAGGWIDKLEELKPKTKQSISNMIVLTAIRHDRVELFAKYVGECGLDFFNLSDCSFNILSWIVSTKIQIKLEVNNITDPKMIKMLYSFVENGGQIVVVNYRFGELETNRIKELTIDEAHGLLRTLEKDNCF